jgi:hypothetical protein
MIQINKIYQNEDVKAEMLLYFNEHAFLSLTDFFVLDLKEIKKKILNSNLETIYNPLSISKKQLNLKNIFDVEILQLVEFFKSEEFLDYITEIVDLDLELKKITVNTYSHKDFIILNDSQAKEETLDVVFDLSDKNWKSDFGGILTYTTKDEEVFYLNPLFNVLTILYNPQDVMRYLKYINNKAKDKNIVRFEMEFEVL